jgi:hypothetical protein
MYNAQGTGGGGWGLENRPKKPSPAPWIDSLMAVLILSKHPSMYIIKIKESLQFLSHS